MARLALFGSKPFPRDWQRKSPQCNSCVAINPQGILIQLCVLTLAPSMLHLFQSFLSKVQSSLQRISRATKNEVSVEELQSDAWIAKSEIEQKRGREIDFADPKDQQLILGALHIRNVRRPEKNVRYAARTDANPLDDDGNPAGWTGQLHADEAADPLVTLMLRESAIDPENMLANSYSQASAYVQIFRHFKGSRGRVCSHLVISDCTLGRRVSSAADSVRVQDSMFDRIERIPSDFLPPLGKQYATKIENRRATDQWAWDFEEAEPQPNRSY